MVNLATLAGHEVIYKSDKVEITSAYNANIEKKIVIKQYVGSNFQRSKLKCDKEFDFLSRIDSPRVIQCYEKVKINQYHPH